MTEISATSQGADLIRLAELIKLSADTAKTLSGSASKGGVKKIVEAADRIDAAADELIELGRKMGRAAALQ